MQVLLENIIIFLRSQMHGAALLSMNKYVRHFIHRVLILDEVDQLDSKNQEVLYTMFEWPALPKSRLILLGMRYNIVSDLMHIF